jgi:hypothetical protein
MSKNASPMTVTRGVSLSVSFLAERICKGKRVQSKPYCECRTASGLQVSHKQRFLVYRLLGHLVQCDQRLQRRNQLHFAIRKYVPNLLHS